MGRLSLADLKPPLGFVCLHRIQQQNPSVRAAFIHVIGDLLQSVGVLVAAYIIYFKVRTGLRRRGAGQYLGLLSLHRAFSILGSL